MASRFSWSVPLPAGFRPAYILAFHQRDPQETAERIVSAGLEKGLLWADAPACLTIHFKAGAAQAELVVDRDVPTHGEAAFRALVHHLLGLNQAIEEFEQRYCGHPQIGPLVSRQTGLRVPVTAIPFEALTWAITGQQISVKAAVALRRRLIQAASLRHSSGLLCYPDARQVAEIPEDALRQAGFSAAKAATLHTVSQAVAEGQLPLESWAQNVPAEKIREELLALRGIGPWTVDYTLLRGFGWLDGSLHGDAGVRRGLQSLLASSERISEAQARDWLAEFSPWRALVAAHLWASRSPGGGEVTNSAENDG